MSNAIDVTISGSVGAYSCVVDACVGVLAQSGAGVTPDAAVASARASAQAAALAFLGATPTPAQLTNIEARLRNACSAAIFIYNNPAPALAPATGFGTDVSTFPDLDPTFTIISGQHVVGEACARRLYCPRGGLLYDSDYGMDVRLLLNAGFTPQQAYVFKTALESECEKDERVIAASAVLAYVNATNTLTATIRVQTSNATAFALTLTVTQVAVNITIIPSA